MNLAYGNALLFLLVLIELIILAFVRKESIPWREVIFNLNSGHILMWIFRGLEVGVYYYVVTHWSLELFKNWNYWLIFFGGFIVWDFCFYWLHRLHHKFPFLWAIHVVHHEGEEYNLSLGIRNSWYSSISSIPFFVGLAFLGIPFEIFMAVSGIHYFVQFYNHNKLINKSGILEKIMVTPSHHRVHHAIHPTYIHHNFGGTLVFWDKLFGTFQPELEDLPMVYGVEGYERTDELFTANNLPLLKLFGLTPKKKAPNGQLSIPTHFVATAGLMLFCLLLYYVYFENVWLANKKIFFFFIIFLGTIGNGAFSSQIKWGVWIWGFVFLILTSIFAVTYQIHEPILRILFGLMAFHSLWLLGTMLKKKA